MRVRKGDNGLHKLDFNIFTDDYTYQRNANHVTRPLEERLKRFYGASRLFLTSSCMEAITALLEYLLPQGGKVLVDRDLYHETKQYLDFVKRYEVVEIDFHDFEAVRNHVAGCDLLYLDNPSFFMKFYDIRTVCDIAHSVGKKVIVDNTLLSFYYLNPIADGADYCVESYTKYVSGHGDVLAGGLVCRDEPKDDLEWFIGRRGRMVNAMTVFLIERSLETLEVRMERHTENGRYIAQKLKENGIDAWYSGYGGCIVLPGMTADDCLKFKKFKKVSTFGLTFSTVSFVRSPLFYQWGNFIRLSCGLEDKEVLWKDVEQAVFGK